MQEKFEIEKKGITITFKKHELDKTRNLRFNTKIGDKEEFISKKYDENKGIIWFHTEKNIKGNNVKAVKINDKETKKKIDKLKKTLISHREKKREEYKQRLKEGDKLVKVKLTGHRFRSLSIYPVDEIKDEIGSKEAIDILNKVAGIDIYGESPDVDKEGKYSIYQVAGDRIEKKEEKDKEFKETKKKAEKTGEKQHIRSYNIRCQDESEDCSWDNVNEYIKPDGEIDREITHTW